MTASKPPRLLFLVPAHNEEKLIASCLQSLTVLRYERFTVCVVATTAPTGPPAWCAQLASGVSSERSDATRQTSRHRLGLDRLPIHDFDAVLIVDADTVVDPISQPR